MVEEHMAMTQNRLHRGTIVWALMNRKQHSLIQALEKLDRHHNTELVAQEDDQDVELSHLPQVILPEQDAYEHYKSDNYNKFEHYVITWDGENYIAHRRIIHYGNCDRCFHILPMGRCCDFEGCNPQQRPKSNRGLRQYFVHDRTLYLPNEDEMDDPEFQRSSSHTGKQQQSAGASALPG